MLKGFRNLKGFETLRNGIHGTLTNVLVLLNCATELPLKKCLESYWFINSYFGQIY